MMKYYLILLVLAFSFLQLKAQEPEKPRQVPVTSSTEQEFENITENNEDQVTEDDSYLQLLVQLQRNPVNLNTVDESFLKEMRLLSPMQIVNLLAYRSVMGKLVSIYELQSIPEWDVATIKIILPYVTVERGVSLAEDISARLKNGDHSILVRVTQVLEKSKGYLLDPAATKNFYPGSPQRLFVRYKYTYKNLLQYGFVAEKDPGEEFFKGSQRKGFDYYSAHLFIRNIGIVKSLALGDFTVNMGQGLTQWMSLAFKKGPDIMAIKRQSSVLRPYNSAGEIFFHRGAGITLGRKNWEATVFGSYRKVDANFNADTTNSQDDFISSLQTSGLHRTASEVEDKGAQRQLAFGGNVAYRIKRLRFGVNAIQYSFKYPLKKAPDPYNLYALTGKDFGNYSVDYSYTLRNLHFFGEAAVTDKNYKAFVNGMLISVANNVDMSFLYRNISKGYQSLYTNAFTENTFPTNEKGFFAGINIKPNARWNISAYADVYKFPWLKSRVNSPTSGKDYMIQVNYRPNRIFEIYSRYKAESKSINFNPDLQPINPVIAQPRQNWRTQMSYKLNSIFTLRSRVELVWFDKKGVATEEGFLMYADVLYKPLMSRLSANMRLQYFETEGYNSRLYAYENDVLYSFSIPVFFDKGYRYYVNLNYDITKKLTVWAKWAQFIYPDKNIIGSGLDEIRSSHRTEVKLQMMYKF